MTKVLKYPLLLGLLFSWAGILNAQCDRQSVIDDYQQFYLGTNVSGSELDWTGSTDSCEAGEISKLSYQLTLDRINYFRRLVGIPTEVIFDSTLNDKAQEAALIMKANNDLDHFPPETWACYSEVGAEAAGKSNLALGTHSASAIRLYMQDAGTDNGPVGHRRWILYSRAHHFGMGSTDRTQALWVIAKKQKDPGIDFIAYPPPGFCPKPLVYKRWSFSKPGANFNEADIAMYDENGAPVELTTLELKQGFGDNTIVWEPDYETTFLYDQMDHIYSVEVNNVLINGSPVNYNYNVVFTNPTIHPPLCFTGSKWDENSCACVSNTTRIQVSESGRIPSIFPNPFNNQLSLNALAEGASFKCYNLAGQLMASLVVSKNQSAINTSLWLPGLYIAQIQAENHLHTIKLVKH